MKGFNIGMVEGIMTEILTSDKKPKNIFGKLARAMGKKKKEDWNAKVSRASLRRDQIGSSQTSLRRSRTSIRRRIQHENEMLLKTLNPEKIVEYNPNLEDYSATTRVAYARFKVNTLKKEKEKKLAAEKKAEVQQKASAANQKLEVEKKGDASSKQFQSRSPSPQVIKSPSPGPAPSSQAPKPPASQTPKPPGTQAPKAPQAPMKQTARPPSPQPPPAPSTTAPRPPGPAPGKVSVPAAFQQQQQGPPAGPPPRSRPPPQASKPMTPPPSQPPPSVPKETTVKVTPPAPAASAPPKTSPAPPPKGPSPSPIAKSPSPASSRAPTPSQDPIAAGKSSVTGQVRTGWL